MGWPCFLRRPAPRDPILGPPDEPNAVGRLGEEEQGRAAQFLPQAETEQGGPCDDDGAALCAVNEITEGAPA